MVCECGTVFCCDDADLTITGAPEKLYCSKKCKNKAWRARYRETAQSCKKRKKVPYPWVSVARAAAARQFSTRGQLYPYLCKCGSWHLTKQPQPAPDQWFRVSGTDSPAFRNWLVRNGLTSGDRMLCWVHDILVVHQQPCRATAPGLAGVPENPGAGGLRVVD